MDNGISSHLGSAIFHLIPWMLSAVLTAIAYRYRDTWWGQLALHEFDLKRRDGESEAGFQRRRGMAWLWTAVLLALFVYIIGQRTAEHGADAPLWEFLAVLFGVGFCFWSLVISVKAFVASRRLQLG